ETARLWRAGLRPLPRSQTMTALGQRPARVSTERSCRVQTKFDITKDKRITIRVPSTLVDELERVAKRQGPDRSAEARRALLAPTPNTWTSNMGAVTRLAPSTS